MLVCSIRYKPQVFSSSKEVEREIGLIMKEMKSSNDHIKQNRTWKEGGGGGGGGILVAWNYAYNR